MKTSRLLGAALLAASLGACTTVSLEEQRRTNEIRCRSYGFRPASDAFAKCLLDVDLDRSAERRHRFDQMMGPRWGPYWGRPWY
jgi:hypothetical protein